VEVLLAAGMLGGVLVLAMGGWRLASGAYTEASVSGPSFRVAADAMDALGTDFRDCVAVLSPDAATLRRGFDPTESVPLVFARKNGGAPDVEAVAQKPSGGLECWTWAAGTAPSGPPWPVVPKTLRNLGAGLTEFSVTWSQDAAGHDFLMLSAMSAHGTPLRTAVQAIDVFPAPGCPTPGGGS
jgi:hypothetical protein